MPHHIIGGWGGLPSHTPAHPRTPPPHTPSCFTHAFHTLPVPQESNIPVPHHIIVDREGLPAGSDPPGFVEHEDWVELNGTRITKPFVEKPASGEAPGVLNQLVEHLYWAELNGTRITKPLREHREWAELNSTRLIPANE